MNVIERWKNNEKAYLYVDAEMKKFAERVGKSEFMILVEEGEYLPGVAKEFKRQTTYRLRQDYQEQEEFETCEIYKEAKYVSDTFMFKTKAEGDKGWYLHEAVDHPDFVGYKFEDGKYRMTPQVYVNKNGLDMCDTNRNELKSGKVTVIRATHVVFKKVGE